MQVLIQMFNEITLMKHNLLVSEYAWTYLFWIFKENEKQIDLKKNNILWELLF